MFNIKPSINNISKDSSQGQLASGAFTLPGANQWGSVLIADSD